jgi:hypothetical protein
MILCSHYLPAQGLQSIQVIENFDGEVNFENAPWKGNAVIVDASSEIKAKDLAFFDNDTSFVKFELGKKGKSELELSELMVEKPSILSFRYRTEIASKAGQTFKLIIDGVVKVNLEGVDTGWRIERIRLGSGVHTLVFQGENARGVYVVGGYNAVYIDDLHIFPDIVSSIAIRPRGVQNTHVGAAGGEKLRFQGLTLLPDGSVKNDAGAFTYTASGGAIDANGVWTPDKPGTFTITAALGGLAVTNDKVTAHPADFLDHPYTYPGTGKTYQGYTGGEHSQNAQPMPVRETLTITNPPRALFEADGFFLIEGIVQNPKGKNYARILVHKVFESGRNAQKLETWYFVQNNFSRRIWLPFGTGEYRIEVIEFDSVTLTSPPKGEGALRGGSYSREPLVFTVYNTREERELVDGDGRWIYPSFNTESDDYRVSNLLNDITFGIGNDADKVRAIHDYMVSTLVYDTQSFSNASRSRKMNAVSVIENATGVCDGYSFLSAALLRNAGIPCKIVANRSIVHSWNNVYIDDKWKFYDATWDDPVPDQGPGIVHHTYYLLDDLRGGDNRHRGAGTALIGDAQ